jgi:hypothetical protein
MSVQQKAVSFLKKKTHFVLFYAMLNVKHSPDCMLPQLCNEKNCLRCHWHLKLISGLFSTSKQRFHQGLFIFPFRLRSVCSAAKLNSL